MKNEKTEFDAEELNLIKLAQEYSDPDKARDLLESLLWPNGPVCPHCKFTEVYKLTPKPGSKSPVRKGLYKCAACRKEFTVTVGTIFEDSHLPISKWLMAFFILCSSKKALSAHQLHRMLGVTYKTAWFIAHRIRHAMSPKMPIGELLKGTVEVDETFVGGKGTHKTKNQIKTPVVALIERGGKARVKVVASVTQKNLGQALNECVDKGAIVNTDDSGASRGTVKEYKAHHVVNHSAKEYTLALPSGHVAHVNTCESFFSLLKRGVYGSWHHVSREHLPKYAKDSHTSKSSDSGDGRGLKRPSNGTIKRRSLNHWNDSNSPLELRPLSDRISKKYETLFTAVSDHLDKSFRYKHDHSPGRERVLINLDQVESFPVASHNFE